MQLCLASQAKIHAGTRVLMRVDLNVPVKRRRISPESDYRIEMVIPDIRYFLKKKARVILVTHLGRPSGRDRMLSTKTIANLLIRKYGLPVRHTSAVTGTVAQKAVDRLRPGEILLLENVRFDEREELNDRVFAKELAKLADVYVNDAFAVSHRTHASVHAITKEIPSFAGPLVAREAKELAKPLPQPGVLMIGGIKLEDKVRLIERLAPQVNVILTGGGIAVTFLSVLKGKLLYAVDKRITLEQQRIADRLLSRFPDLIRLPSDLRVAEKVTATRFAVRTVEALRVKDRIFDIGPNTEVEYADAVLGSRGVIWNGPFGYVERTGAQHGTRAIAKMVAQKHWKRTVVGGGDTLRFLYEEGHRETFSFVSTGGGAMLHYLAGGEMPGMKVLKK